MPQTAVERSRNADFMEQKYWGQTWRQGTDTRPSTTEAQSMPHQVCSRKTAQRKTSEIQGSYKPKQPSPPTQPSPPRQNELSKVRRKGNVSLGTPMGQRVRRSLSHSSEASLPGSPTGRGEEKSTCTTIERKLIKQ